MSLIEKASEQYKLKKNTRNRKKKLSPSINIPSENKDVLKTDSDPSKQGSVDFLLDPINDTDVSNESPQIETVSIKVDEKTILSEDLPNDATEIDITDISGYDGFKIEAKKSHHSINIHLDLNKLNENGFITPKHPDTPLSSSYRIIKRPLLDNAAGKNATLLKNANLIMFTSSLANEGKTYSAINTAISIAMEKDLHVLLIDADIKKPSIAKTFDVESKVGFTDILSGKESHIKNVLHSTNIPKLSLMFAGSSHPNSTELLSSDSMTHFIEEISSRYSDRIIIFDTPPLLQTTESIALATHMGQVVLVVEAEKTHSSHVKKSIEIINNEIVLLLLNKQREKKNDLNYGYGYGY